MLKHILGLVLNTVKASKPTDILPQKNSENFFKKKGIRKNNYIYPCGTKYRSTISLKMFCKAAVYIKLLAV